MALEAQCMYLSGGLKKYRPQQSNFYKKSERFTARTGFDLYPLTLLFMTLYSKLQVKVVTKNWATEVFQFWRGIFASDNYSQIIFNIVFHPLIDFILKSKESQGYKLGSATIIIKPFAADF